MLEQIFEELTAAQIIGSILIIAAFVGLALFFKFYLKKVAKRLARKTKTPLDDVIISTAEKPLFAAIVLGGLYLAGIHLPLATVPDSLFTKAMSIVLSLLGIYIAAVIIGTSIKSYGRDVKQKKKEVGLVVGILELVRILIIPFALFMGVLVTLTILGVQISAISGWMGEHGWRIILIIVLSVAGLIFIGEYVPKLVVRSLARRSEEPAEEIGKRGNTLSRVLTDSMQVFIILISIFTILSELGIDIIPILAGASVAGIAIGLGAQSMIKDIIAGVFVLMENQYRVGDVVNIADKGGIVEDINLRRTILRDLDGIVHVVPNGEIRVASNLTKEWSRVNHNISVAYGEDLDHVFSVINRVGKELAEDPRWAPYIIIPPSALRVDNLGDSGIDIKILGDTKPIRQWDVMGELRKRLKKAFDEEGIEIPWPHTKVFFGNSLASSGRYQASEGKSQE